MNHSEYDHMKKEFKIASYGLGVFFLLAFAIIIITLSCTSTQNICKTDVRVSGEVIYAIPAPHCTRNVVMKTEKGYIKIYGVPLEQPLVNIPVCKAHGKWYWVMP